MNYRGLFYLSSHFLYCLWFLKNMFHFGINVERNKLKRSVFSGWLTYLPNVRGEKRKKQRQMSKEQGRMPWAFPGLPGLCLAHPWRSLPELFSLDELPPPSTSLSHVHARDLWMAAGCQLSLPSPAKLGDDYTILLRIGVPSPENAWQEVFTGCPATLMSQLPCECDTSSGSYSC